MILNLSVLEDVVHVRGAIEVEGILGDLDIEVRQGEDFWVYPMMTW